MAQPSYVPASVKELSLLSDEIYFLAGDKAVDPSWYTKRASLGMVYVSSELFMTTDRSPGFAETRAFLQRRLEETRRAGSVLGAVGEWAGFTANAGVNLLRSKGLRI
jgi:ubiquinone biosynthesis protein COQ9